MSPVQSKADDEPARPPIWATGRQRPRFDFGAFAGVALAMARRDLAPAMEDAARRLRAFGTKVEAGDIRVTGLWAKRILPPHQPVGRAILGLAAALGDGRLLIAPQVEPVTYPNLIRPEFGLKPAAPKRPQAAPSEPTLHAIRSALGTKTHDFALEEPRFAPLAAPSPPQGLWRAVCGALLALMMPFALAGGAARAVQYHLNGGDLRDWS